MSALEHQLAQLNARAVGLAGFLGATLAIAGPIIAREPDALPAWSYRVGGCAAFAALITVLFGALWPRGAGGALPGTDLRAARVLFDDDSELTAALTRARLSALDQLAVTYALELDRMARALRGTYSLFTIAVTSLGIGAIVETV